MTMVWLARMARSLLASRAPVGSSTRMSAGRLISARDAQTLLLAAGEQRRQVAKAILQADALERPGRLLLVGHAVHGASERFARARETTATVRARREPLRTLRSRRAPGASTRRRSPVRRFVVLPLCAARACPWRRSRRGA